MKFTEDMIGRTVRELGTGDIGTITKQHTPTFLEDYGSGSERVYVKWTTGKETNQELHIGLDQIEFTDRLTTVDYDTVIVEIAGVKYKLVPL